MTEQRNTTDYAPIGGSRKANTLSLVVGIVVLFAYYAAVAVFFWQWSANDLVPLFAGKSDTYKGIATVGALVVVPWLLSFVSGMFAHWCVDRKFN